MINKKNNCQLSIINCQFLILISLFAISCTQSDSPDLSWAKEAGARTFPVETQTFNVTDYGTVADGKTLDTEAIQQAIDDCASKGGGIVTFSSGNYLTGSIYLKVGACEKNMKLKAFDG